MPRVTLIDHGAGNLRSLRAAFERLGADVEVTADADRVAAAERVVLPGVGAAAPAMRTLARTGMADALREPPSLLGVCLGMQLLFEQSAEGDVACLGLLPGTVERIGWAERLPHMGWNDVVATGDGPLRPALPAVCYFAHSYAVAPSRPRGRGGRDRHRRPRGAQRGRVRPGRRRAVPSREERPRRARRMLEAWLAA